jgi:hypothetical protein
MNNTVSECVEALKNVRREMHDDIDPGLGTALDEVITKFEGYLNAGPVEEAAVCVTVAEALVVISSILSCCSSIADLIGRF